jgi:NosR/NirI family nitrous oxide reductase transcriptional regulator
VLGALLVAGFLAGASAAACGQELLSRPEIPGYDTPDWQQAQRTAQPRSVAMEYLDTAALAAGLALATYLALRRRSRWGLLALGVASLAWLGFWRKGCVCPIGAVQNVTLGLFDPGYTVPLVVLAFFTLPLVVTLFFGRTFCAAVCPLGAVQELVAVRPVRVPRWLEQALGLVPYVYLGAAVALTATGAGFIICRYDPFVGFFRLSAGAGMLVFGGLLLLVGVFVGRPYCRFLCPYGAILGLLSRLSKWHVDIPPEACINCRLCEDVCPYGAIRGPTVPQTADQRRAGRRRLAALLALAPVLVGGAAWLGSALEVPLSWMHPTVQLAERVRLEEAAAAAGRDVGTTDASDAFRNTGRPNRELYAEAAGLRGRFGIAGTLLGGWVGLVLAAKLVHLSIRRRRDVFRPDRAACVSCGRCFEYCPLEQLRRGWIQDVAEVVPQPEREPMPEREPVPGR